RPPDGARRPLERRSRSRPGRASRGTPREALRAREDRRSAQRRRRQAPSIHGQPQVKKALQVTLGILTAIGGFVDIGDLVANAETGARFKLALAWAVIVGAIGIVVYAEMAGRVAAVTHRPVFSLVRERLGPGFGL